MADKFRKIPVVVEAMRFDGSRESGNAIRFYPCKPDVFAATYERVEADHA